MHSTQQRLFWTGLARLAAEHGYIACVGNEGVEIDLRFRDPATRELRYVTCRITSLPELHAALRA